MCVVDSIQDCCSELEAIGAGAPHAETKAEKEDQIIRDVPRVSYKIMGEDFGCAMGENVDANITEKKVKNYYYYYYYYSKFSRSNSQYYVN